MLETIEKIKKMRREEEEERRRKQEVEKPKQQQQQQMRPSLSLTEVPPFTTLKPRKTFTTAEFEDDFDAYDRDVFNYASASSRSRGVGGGSRPSPARKPSKPFEISSSATTTAAAKLAALARKERIRTISENIHKYSDAAMDGGAVRKKSAAKEAKAGMAKASTTKMRLASSVGVPLPTNHSANELSTTALNGSGGNMEEMRKERRRRRRRLKSQTSNSTNSSTSSSSEVEDDWVDVKSCFGSSEYLGLRSNVVGSAGENKPEMMRYRPANRKNSSGLGAAGGKRETSVGQKALINPFKPAVLQFKMTSNRRRWEWKLPFVFFSLSP